MPSDPDTVSLREFIERIIAEKDKAHEAVRQRQSEALVEARNAIEKRLDGMNEFREALQDARANSITRETFDTRLTAIDKNIASLENWKSKVTGIVLALTTLGGIVGGLIGTVAAALVKGK